ncbi:MAG: rhodanese-like domain-containing protein [Candidatus Kapabacteria bacterium]|nr:rhodanese-like domain-containing protein [Candidatus Kapabacteria bacterium]
MLRSLLGGSNDELVQALRQGAVVIDVRTRAEYQGGHVAGSKNIPLNEVSTALEGHPKGTPIVFCCASGGRSGQATSYATSKGYTAVNGGPWTSVNKAVSELQQGQ